MAEIKFIYNSEKSPTMVDVFLNDRKIAYATKVIGAKSKKRVWSISIRGLTWITSEEESGNPIKGFLSKTWSKKDNMEKELTKALTTGEGTILNIYSGHNLEMLKL